MNKFYGLSNPIESQRNLEDHSYQELRKGKLELYQESQEFFNIDFFSAPEAEIIDFLKKLSSQQRSEAMEFLSQIVTLIAEQIEKLQRDQEPDKNQAEIINSVKSEESRVNRFLIELGYFK